jgi:hypothetical protein
MIRIISSQRLNQCALIKGRNAHGSCQQGRPLHYDRASFLASSLPKIFETAPRVSLGVVDNDYSGGHVGLLLNLLSYNFS